MIAAGIASLVLNLTGVQRVSKASEKPRTNEVSSQRAVQLSVRTLRNLGYRVDGRDAGLCLIRDGGIGVWRIVMGPPEGTAYSLLLDAQTGRLLRFSDNLREHGYRLLDTPRTLALGEDAIRNLALDLARKLGVPAKSVLTKVRVDSTYSSQRGVYRVRTGVATFVGPTYRYPLRPANGASLYFDRDAGKLLSCNMSYNEPTGPQEPRLSEVAALHEVARFDAVLAKQKVLKKRLVFARFGGEVGKKTIAPASPDLRLVWEFTFQNWQVIVDAIRGGVVGGNEYHWHPPHPLLR